VATDFAHPRGRLGRRDSDLPRDEVASDRSNRQANEAVAEEATCEVLCLGGSG
jgi:hypothetical protein